MKDNPTYPVDCRVGRGSGYVMERTNNTEKWSPYNEQFGIVEARMRSQEVQSTCLWALAASEAGKPERLTVSAIGVHPGGRPKGKSCLENC